MPTSDFDGLYGRLEDGCPRQMVWTDIEALDVGDIVRLRYGGMAYVVVGPYSKTHGALAIRTMTVTNSGEWELIRKAKPPARYL